MVDDTLGGSRTASAPASGMVRLTREQAAIIGAYTGYLAGPFSDMHGYIERIMGRPVWTHEMGNKDFAARIREAAKPDFLAIVTKEPDGAA